MSIDRLVRELVSYMPPNEVYACRTRPCLGNREAWEERDSETRGTSRRKHGPRTAEQKAKDAANANAKAACNQCPVLDACRAWGLQVIDPAPGMIVGGLTTAERRRLRKEAS